MSGGRSDQGPDLPQVDPPAALWRGAITALVVVLPVGVINQLLIDAGDIEPTSPVTMLLWVLILLGGAAGGWATIRLSREAPLSYAAGAAAIAYVVVQSIGVIRRLIAGESINWLGYPLLCLLMAVVGALGGMFARRWQAPPSTDVDGASKSGGRRSGGWSGRAN